MPRLAVDIAEFQGQFAGTQILALHFEAIQAVIQLAVDALTVFGEIGFTDQFHPFQNGHLFAFHGNRHFTQADLLVAHALAKGGHTAVAVGFEIIEGQLNLLIVFVNRVDQATFRRAAQGKHVTVAIRVEFEIAAAEGHFLVAFFIIQRFQGDIGACIAGVADACFHHKRRLIFRQFKQRFRRFVVDQRGFYRRHGRNQIEMLQLCQRERTVIDNFVQHHAVTVFQPAVFGARNGFNHQLHMAFEDAALIVLIA
ncbi:hypothetical protein D3C72_1349880 [compost metagenome]